MKGVVVNTGIGAACSLPVVGPAISAGLLFAGATSAYAWASSKLSKFERDNFILGEDYENIMRNPLISDEQKQQISRDAHARYEQVQQHRENARSNSASIIDSVTDMWSHDPERLGLNVGLFFGFRKPIAGLATINSNPIRPGLSFKIHTIKSRIQKEMLPQEGRIRFIPDSKYNPSIILDRGVNNGILDKFGNEWTKGPSRTLGEAFEWDVVLSKQGKLQLGWLSKDGKHINVSLKGRITHK